MSIAQSAPQVVTVFKDLVQRNPEICNNCFRHWRRMYENNYAVESDGYVRPLNDSVLEIIGPEIDSVDEVTVEYQHEVCGGKTFACECGHRNATSRPVSLSTGIEMTHRLVELLESEGIEFDTDTLYDHVRSELEQPENQGRQDSVFDEAVEVAIDGR